MKKLIILALVSISMAATAASKTQQAQTSTAPIPPVDYHIPTKAELIPDFTEGFKGHLDHAQEYWGNQPDLLKEEIRLNTVTPEDVDKVAGWVADSLQRQYEECQKLQAQYPKTQVPGANCVTSVLMVNGLGHPNDHRMIMELLADKTKAKQFLANMDNKDNKYQINASLKTLKNGIDAKKKVLDSRDVEEIEHALGFLALTKITKDQINEALK